MFKMNPNKEVKGKWSDYSLILFLSYTVRYLKKHLFSIDSQFDNFVSFLSNN